MKQIVIKLLTNKAMRSSKTLTVIAISGAIIMRPWGA